jgi:hypothetical protein
MCRIVGNFFSNFDEHYCRKMEEEDEKKFELLREVANFKPTFSLKAFTRLAKDEVKELMIEKKISVEDRDPFYLLWEKRNQGMLVFPYFVCIGFLSSLFFCISHLIQVIPSFFFFLPSFFSLLPSPFSLFPS